MENFPMPLDDPTPGAWRAYADWLVDSGQAPCYPYGDGTPCWHHYKRALRFARGLERRPRLVLVGAEQPGFWPPGANLRRPIPPGKNWRTFCQLSWWLPTTVERRFPTVRRRKGGLFIDRGRTRLDSTPAEFTGMLAVGPSLYWAFYWKCCEGVKIEVRGDGEVWEITARQKASRIY